MPTSVIIRCHIYIFLYVVGKKYFKIAQQIKVLANKPGEFDLRDSHCGRREPTPSSYPSDLQHCNMGCVPLPPPCPRIHMQMRPCAHTCINTCTYYVHTHS